MLNEDGYGRKQSIKSHTQHVQHAYDLLPILVINLITSEQIWEQHSMYFFLKKLSNNVFCSLTGEI